MNGLLLVDKKPGITSHDVVLHIRKVAGIKKVGHTGTLDPSATGLMILCVGAATRLSEFLTMLDKTYAGSMRLGITTSSYDLDGEIVKKRPLPPLTLEEIQKVFDNFKGTILQTPPMVSAVKVRGQRLYKLARQGQEVERQPRSITIYEFVAENYTPPDIKFVVRCSSGTYARALCHDVGELLGCGAALVSLRRTWVGHYSVDKAVPMDELTSKEVVKANLLPMEQALNLPEVIVCKRAEEIVANGRPVDRSHLKEDCPIDTGWVQIKNEMGELLALGEIGEGKQIRPRRVLVSK